MIYKLIIHKDWLHLEVERNLAADEAAALIFMFQSRLVITFRYLLELGACTAAEEVPKVRAF
jgi:hypothetical protein